MRFFPNFWCLSPFEYVLATCQLFDLWISLSLAFICTESMTRFPLIDPKYFFFAPGGHDPPSVLMINPREAGKRKTDVKFLLRPWVDFASLLAMLCFF